jgi:endonuclease I/chitodextrinase
MIKALTSAKSTKTTNPNKFTTPLLLFLILFSFQLFGQVPAGYYDAAAGQSGAQLKASLHEIIKGHITFPYTSSSTDVWDILKEADKDPTDPTKVVGIYSNFRMDAAGEYNSGAGWNREHVWAKSRGDFGTSQGAGTDCHHLRAADISTNSARNNRNFDYADNFYVDASGTYNGPTESKTSSSSYVWEPRDEVKGDVARMMFYMATRYEGGGEPDLELTEILLDNTDKSPIHARLSVLLEWHQMDPVTDAERERNNIVYSFQNNRNPFIDNPEYVCLIYACDGAPANTAPSFTSNATTNTTAGQTYQYAINVTDAESDPISISATTLPSWLSFTDNGDGSAQLSGLSTTANVGTHNVVIEAADGALSASQSFSITVNAVATGGSAADLFISEYIEGSSFNKGLEIANFTGVPVDLSSYSLFKQTNGAGAWSSELVLSGTLADGQVYVIVHTSADASMQAEADLVTGVGALTFNGNDPVALFKNGSLLDELGVLDNTSDFAKDVTLVRKPAITSPTINYTPAEWETLTTDTFSDLGSHTIDLGSGGSDTETPTVPQNVQVSNVTSSSFDISWSPATDNVGVAAYELFKDGVSVASSITTSYSFTSLTPATTYLINVLAKDAAANSSAQSSTISVSTPNSSDTEAPSTVVNLSASDVSDLSFTLNWSSATDNIAVSSYDLYIDDTFEANVTATSYQFTGLQQLTTYGMMVIAKDGAGNESADSQVLAVSTIATPDTEAPISPSTLQSANITINSFTLSWTASTDNVAVTSYRIYLEGVLIGSSVSATYDIANLEAGTAYVTYVVAVDEAGNSSTNSVPLTVNTLTVPDTEAPSVPTGLAADFVGVNSASIGWQAASDNIVVSGYVVYLDGLQLDQVEQLTYTFLGLSAVTTYEVGVASIDGAGNESAISSITITTNSDQVQGPQIISQSFFEAGWGDWVSGGSNASYYRGSYAYEGNSAIRITDDRGEGSSMSTTVLDVNNFNQLSFEFYFYANRMDYGDQFEVAYHDGQIWNTISTYTEGIDFTDRGFYLATVYVDRSFYNFPQNARFRIQGLADNKKDQLYFDQITIMGIIADSALRQTGDGLKSTIKKVGGEVSIESSSSLFPNPTTSGYIHFKKEYDEETEVSLSLLDSKGNLIYQSKEMVIEGFYETIINIGAFKAGVYFMQVKDQKGSLEIKKFVVR